MIKPKLRKPLKHIIIECNKDEEDNEYSEPLTPNPLNTNSRKEKVNQTKCEFEINPESLHMH